MWKLDEIAERIYSGHRVERITVRDLLHQFGAERRGYWIVRQIKERLDQLKLRTEPDFEHVWIDSLIGFIPTKPILVAQDPTQDEEAQRESETAPQPIFAPAMENQAESTSIDPEAVLLDGAGDFMPAGIGAERPNLLKNTTAFTDHTFRIGQLASANTILVTVNENDSLIIGITKMRLNDFSQLPVMQGSRIVKGMLSWKSIASRRSIGMAAERVGECMERPLVFDADEPLFAATSAINNGGYALIRNRKDGTISGIVTCSDLANHFQQLTLPFLLLSEVELHIRELLQGRVNQADLRSLSYPPAPVTVPNEIDKLTFGQYVSLFGREDIWTKLGIPFDQHSVVEQLDTVRKIRNEVMHFDPDPLSQDDLTSLKNAARFMREILEDLLDRQMDASDMVVNGE